MKTLELYYNMPGQFWADASGAPLPPRQRPVVGIENVLFRLHLLESDGSFYPLASDFSFAAAATTRFSNGVVFMQTTNDMFNIPNDWSGSDGISIPAGRICFRSNFATTELVSILGTDEMDRYPLQVYMIEGGSLVDHCTEQIIVENVIDTTGIIPVPIQGLVTGTQIIVSGLDNVTVFADVSTGKPIVTLYAPLGDTNNIGIANVQCAADNGSFTVYFTAPIPSSGYSIAFLIYS